MEGQILAGKYRLVRLLGKGGMGSVWMAEHLSLKTAVAIKLIDSEIARNPTVRARFDREAQIAARIRSAHIAQVLDHGIAEDDVPYIAMECLHGETLRDRLTARGRLTLVETGRIATHVCRAMSRAHELGLVHRDLKPENIFLARQDDEEIGKVLDFGIAKATDILSADGVDPTRTGALLGTPFYMSPEQAQGLKTVDYRSDLWSLGVVIFECLTGERPFLAPALGPMIAKIVFGPIPSPTRAAPDARIPVEVDAWMQKALSRDPAARFASARELSESFMIAAGTADSNLSRSDPPRYSQTPGAPVMPAASLQALSGTQIMEARPAAVRPPAPDDAESMAATIAREPSPGAAVTPAMTTSEIIDPPPMARSTAPLVIGALVLLAAIGGIAMLVLGR